MKTKDSRKEYMTPIFEIQNVMVTEVEMTVDEIQSHLKEKEAFFRPLSSVPQMLIYQNSLYGSYACLLDKSGKVMPIGKDSIVPKGTCVPFEKRAAT